MTARLFSHRSLMCAAVLVASAMGASAQTFFQPGNLVVSRSAYDNNPNNVKVGEILPPDCINTQGECAGAATNDGTYPTVWNNALVDGSFGDHIADFPRSIHNCRFAGEHA